MSTLTISIIGTGIVGERIINQCLKHASFTIAAIFDENTDRLLEMATKYSLQATQTLEELLEIKVDWVYIGTPPVSHAPLAEVIAKRGMNILSEKPLAHDAAGGERMVRAAKEGNVLTAMHFPMMYSPCVVDVKAMLDAEALGDIKRVELSVYLPHWPRLWQQNPWIGSREQGGFIREIFPHYFQMLHFYFGDLTISAHHTTYPDDVTLCETGVTAIGTVVGSNSAAAGGESAPPLPIPVVINGLSSIGQEECIDFKIFGSKKVVSIRNWSEIWVAEMDTPFLKVDPISQPYSMLEACRRLVAGEEAVVAGFEEGLKVQRWIDELLK